MRAIQRMLRRRGINVLFKDVICPQHMKTVWLRTDGQVETTIDRTLVFLRAPGPGAVRDVVAWVRPDEKVFYESSDARGLARRSNPNGTYVYWTPRAEVVPYALYPHQLRWTTPGPTREPAVYTDLFCETRTGLLSLQIVTPATFETAVIFKRPRWRQLATESSLMKHALKQLESGGDKPFIVDKGSRLEWTIAGPRINERYVCVAFHEGGVALWQRRLAAGSLTARLRRLIRLEAR